MQVIQKGNRVVVKGEGELDLSNSQELRESLDNAMDSSPVDIVLDLTESSYIDSAVLQELVRAHNQLSKQDRRFIVIAKPNSQPGQVLHTVMFHTIMTVAGGWEDLPE